MKAFQDLQSRMRKNRNQQRSVDSLFRERNCQTQQQVRRIHGNELQHFEGLPILRPRYRPDTTKFGSGRSLKKVSSQQCFEDQVKGSKLIENMDKKEIVVSDGMEVRQQIAKICKMQYPGQYTFKPSKLDPRIEQLRRKNSEQFRLAATNFLVKKKMARQVSTRSGIKYLKNDESALSLNNLKDQVQRIIQSSDKPISLNDFLDIANNNEDVALDLLIEQRRQMQIQEVNEEDDL